MEERLRKIEGICERIDERTCNMQKAQVHSDEILHKRIDSARKEAKDDVADVRGEMKRMAGIISTAVSGLVSAVALSIKALVGGGQ